MKLKNSEKYFIYDSFEFVTIHRTYVLQLYRSRTNPREHLQIKDINFRSTSRLLLISDLYLHSIAQF